MTSLTSRPTDENNPTPLPIRGADVSSLQHAEDVGAIYYYEDGVQGDPVKILHDHGANYIRLRVWVNPANGYNNKAKVAQFAQRVKDSGLKLLIDLHYSDTWADPEHQVKPAAWVEHDFSQLQADVYDYTYGVCNALKSAGAMPDMVQIGNEITPGMLLPDGSTADWDKLANLLNQGYEAVKSCNRSTLVMLHIDKGGDNGAARAWFDNAMAHEVKWDVIGLSYYSFWHGALVALKSNITDLKSRYGKPVIVVETSYPFTLQENDGEKNVIHSLSQLHPDYPATPAGQADNFKAVLNAARSAGAMGVFYWEPTWTAVKGNGWDPTDPNSGDQWENQALFDFNGIALPAMSEFKS
jgi:arabinogalactan endo-1,4-beta-galactosidase